MNGRLEAAYVASPWWLQNVAVTAYGYWWRHRRFGGKFAEHVSAFLSRDRFTHGDWSIYQTRELRRVLVHAATHVPFYRSAWSKSDVTLFHRFRLEDLQELPILEKEQIRKDANQLIGDDAASNLEMHATSGTTGTPISIAYSADFHRRWS